MHFMAAPQTGEALLVAAIAFIEVAASRAGLAAVGRVHFRGLDPVAVGEVCQLGPDDGSPAVAQDGIQAPRQAGMAEVETFQHNLCWLAAIIESSAS